MTPDPINHLEMNKDKKNKMTLSWEDFQSLGNPENVPEVPASVPSQPQGSLVKSSDKVRVYLEKKGRGGKSVSLIKGLSNPSSELEQLCKKIKTSCGVGGKLEEEGIMIQGDQRRKIIELLLKMGYRDVKNAGA